MAEAFNSSNILLTTTNATDLYQAPNAADANRAIILSCMVANKKSAATGSVGITITVTDSANAVVSTWASGLPVPNSASIEVIANKLILRRGQKLRATAGEASQLDVTVSVLEIT